MAKFFITNNSEWYKKTKERINASDFKLAFEYGKDGVYALTTHKLNIKNINAYKDPKTDNFVMATGTAVYKESLDYSLLFRDFNENIEEIRDNTIGHYAYTFSSNGKITIFGDGFGTYDIYYYKGDGYYYVSNFLYDMAVVLRSKITVNECNIIENALRRAIFCGGTAFNEIKSLNGDEYITIIDGTLAINPLPYDWSINESTDSVEAAHKIAQKLADKSRVLYKLFGDPNIYMTGGLDSRMSLAAYLRNGSKPTLSYGLSNTHIAYPDIEDAEIVHTMANTFGCVDNVMEWDTRYPDKEWDQYLQRYGFLYEFWCGTDCMMKSFEASKNKLCTFGLGGEMYRSNNIYKNRVYLTDEIIAYDYYWSKELGVNTPEVLSHMSNKLSEIASKYHIDLRHITPEEYFYFDKEVRRHHDAGGGMANLLNLICYSDILLLERDIVACARIPLKYLANAQLMLRTMNELYPEVLKLPIHSHHELCKFDPQSMTLLSGLDSQRSLLIIQLKRLYTKHKKLLQPLREFYKNIERKYIKPKTEATKHAEYKSDEKKSTYSKISTSFCRPINIPEPSLAILHTMDLKAIDSIVKA